MRLPNAAFTDRPWRIHEFTGDFIVEDVWELPTPGGPGDLDRLVRQFTSDDDDEISDFAIRTLFSIRWKLGAALGWDKPGQGLGKGVQSLRERLPEDLRTGPRGPDFAVVPFYSVYQTDTEWTAEIGNRTVHGLMHIGWVPDKVGDGHHAEMTALIKPRGLLGTVYMNGIKPLRRIVVYPQLIRSIGKNWPRYA